MLNKDPLVSVVIPTYKRSDMLLNAVESVKNQTYKNIEIIIVDDNDKDSEYRKETKNKLKKYIELNEIRYIENEKNIGGSLTRNRGIKEARGRYVAFLDDDDIFMPIKIEKQVRLIEKNVNKGVGLVYCHCNGVDDEGNIIWKNTNNYLGLPLYESMIYCIASTSLWLCDRKMLLDIGGFEDMPSKQDLLLMVKIIANGYKILCCEEILAEYRAHEQERISNVIPNNKTLQGYRILREYCRKNYKKLKQNESKEVEYRFSRIMSLQYLGVGQGKRALREVLTMIKIRPLRLVNIKILGKIFLSKLNLGDIA